MFALSILANSVSSAVSATVHSTIAGIPALEAIIASGVAALSPGIAAAAPLRASGPEGEGLTLAEVIANVPHDPAAIFTYLLLIASIGGILWIGRPRKPRSPGAVS